MRNRETAKLSSSESPKILKHKPALEEKYKDTQKKEIEGYERLKSKETTKLPKPTGWRILVLPFKLPEKTRGGIYLGEPTLERQQGSFNMWISFRNGSSLL